MSEETKDIQAEEAAPMTIAEEIAAKLGNAVTASKTLLGEPCVLIEPENLLKVMKYLHEEHTPPFKMLADLCGVDYPNDEKRFEVVYQLVSLESCERLMVKTRVAAGGEIPSLTSIWKSADWQEREAYDMFGIIFAGHPNLKRILMWEGFDGWPLRKDFPLKGNVPPEERYAANDKRRAKDMKQFCWEGYCTEL